MQASFWNRLCSILCCMSWITTRNDGDTTIEASSRIVRMHNLPILFGR